MPSPSAQASKQSKGSLESSPCPRLWQALWYRSVSGGRSHEVTSANTYRAQWVINLARGTAHAHGPTAHLIIALQDIRDRILRG